MTPLEKQEVIDADAIAIQNGLCDIDIPIVCEVNFTKHGGRIINALHYDYGKLEGPELEWIDLQFIRMGYKPIGPMEYAPHDRQL